MLRSGDKKLSNISFHFLIFLRNMTQEEKLFKKLFKKVGNGSKMKSYALVINNN